MIRVLLIHPPSPERLGGPLVGLQYIASALIARGHDVRVIDAAGRTFSPQSEWILAEAARFSPDMVGFVLYTRWVWHAYRLVEQFHGRFPMLIAGGPHATACPEEVLRRGFDVAVLGEAEQTITRLADLREGAGSLQDIPGIRYLDTDGNMCGGGSAAHIEDLDCLTFPHRSLHLFRSEWYGYTEWPPVSNGLVSSRGCPARCTFCANYVTGRSFRFRSAENIAAEMLESWLLSGTDFFPFWDDALTANPERLMHLCAVMERNLPFAPRWSATTRVTMVNPPLLAAMKQAGLAHLNFGVESGDDATLQSIGKDIRGDHVIRALEMTQHAGLRASCNFMFGFPGETPEALERTLRFMERIAPLVDFFSPSGVLIPMPATPVYEQNHKHFGFTEWWLKEEYSHLQERPESMSFGEFSGSYARDPALELNFFRYTEETRTMILACLEFKARHNLRRIQGGQADLRAIESSL